MDGERNKERGGEAESWEINFDFCVQFHVNFFHVLTSAQIWHNPGTVYTNVIFLHNVTHMK